MEVGPGAVQEIGFYLAFVALDLEAYQTTDLRGMADGCLKMPRMETDSM